jgi:hypothetical protein
VRHAVVRLLGLDVQERECMVYCSHRYAHVYGRLTLLQRMHRRLPTNIMYGHGPQPATPTHTNTPLSLALLSPQC